MIRPTLVLSFVAVCVLSLVVVVKTKTSAHSAAFNSPPVANDDTYTVHGGGPIGLLTQNDHDPDGDTMNASIVTFPNHGQLSGLTNSSYSYQLNVLSYVGTDSFTYKVCAAGQRSNVATVTLNIVNGAPTAVNDSYTVHGPTNIGPMLVNDSDPDGDQIIWDFLTPPSHGSIQGVSSTLPPSTKRYSPDFGYTGPDSFTYRACDSLGLCSAPAIVSVNVVNLPPDLDPDDYDVRGPTIIGPFKQNDEDPEGDTLGSASMIVPPTNGAVLGVASPPYPPDVKQYVPNAGLPVKTRLCTRFAIISAHARLRPLH